MDGVSPPSALSLQCKESDVRVKWLMLLRGEQQPKKVLEKLNKAGVTLSLVKSGNAFWRRKCLSLKSWLIFGR